ncbi:hypothetical protein N7535_000450 [Penicillium sp. DV-2018c]|nr:hypothetical protein N7535_000450 [Penicillium sp. DV-2018c]
MSSLASFLALVPLALAATTPAVWQPQQPMIFKENDWAINIGRRGWPLVPNGSYQVPEYRNNIGSIYVPCTSDVRQDMICTLYSDNNCNTELFTFTRPHANLLTNDGIGRHAGSMRCMNVTSPADRNSHIFSSDHPSTKSPSACPNDSCSTDREHNCQSTHPGYGMYCSTSTRSCQRTAAIGGLCREDTQCVASVCTGGRCMASVEGSPCARGSECASGLECRPHRAINSFGVSAVETVCMRGDDARGRQCSMQNPCAEHMMCSLQHGTNSYCEWDGTWTGV